MCCAWMVDTVNLPILPAALMATPRLFILVRRRFPRRILVFGAAVFGISIGCGPLNR